MLKLLKKMVITSVILSITSVIFCTSCDSDIDPDSSVLKVDFNGMVLDGNSYTINIDEIEIKGGYFNFSLVYYKGEEEVQSEENVIFSFNKDVEILSYKGKKNSCSVSLSSFKELGTYVLTCESEWGDKFNKSFVITLNSNVEEIKVLYNINEEYNREEYEISDEMKSGVITGQTRDVNLVRGAIYTLKAEDVKSEGGSIKRIKIKTSDDSVVYSRNIVNDSGEIVIIGNEGKRVEITVSLGDSLVERSFIITIKECVRAEIEEIIGGEKSDEMLVCLNKSDGEKKYSFRLYSPGERDLLFSVDAENIEQERYYDGSVKKYIPSKKEEATWYSESLLVWNYKEYTNDRGTFGDGKDYWGVRVNGSKKEFTIVQNEIEKRDTTFNFNGEKNLHTYLYIKYKDDEVYRWKVRIMIGGVLEGMELYLVEGDTESKVEGDIIINEESTLGWKVRVKYIPETYEDNETYVYIADATKMASYSFFDTEITAPLPGGDKENSVLLLSSSETLEKTIIGEGKDKPLKVGYYSLLEKGSEDKDVYISYNNTGESVKLVAMNKESGMYCSFVFKNETKNGIWVKSMVMRGDESLLGEPYTTSVKSTVILKDNKSYKTMYNKNSSIQEYPLTIDKNTKERTFYVQANGIIDINIISTMDIDSLSVNYTPDASDFLGGMVSSINEKNKRLGVIRINTRYSELSKDEKRTEKGNINKYLTDNNGVEVYINLTSGESTYVIGIKLIIYKS